MLFQCSCILFPKSETFFHLTTEQLLQDVFCVRSEVVLQLQLPLQYPLGDDLPVVSSEGRGPCEHVVNEDPKAPPVHFLAMSTNRVETLIVLRFTIKERERRNERFQLKNAVLNARNPNVIIGKYFTEPSRKENT